jgi:ATP-dependent Lon protease
MVPSRAPSSSAGTRKTLDKAVYGMQGAKTQIMQILAQWISNPTVCRQRHRTAQGPMGVGKTSFAAQRNCDGTQSAIRVLQSGWSIG